jgi:hypothetical protein
MLQCTWVRAEDRGSTFLRNVGIYLQVHDPTIDRHYAGGRGLGSFCGSSFKTVWYPLYCVSCRPVSSYVWKKLSRTPLYSMARERIMNKMLLFWKGSAPQRTLPASRRIPRHNTHTVEYSSVTTLWFLGTDSLLQPHGAESSLISWQSLSWSRNSLPVIELEESSSCAQDPATGPYLSRMNPDHTLTLF